MSSIIESEKPEPAPERCACSSQDQQVELQDVVRVVFMDHAQDLGQPLVCVVYGVIEHIDNSFINITSWHPEDLTDNSESNRTTYTIIRSCIKQLDVFT
jgi:hypothetical protein